MDGNDVESGFGELAVSQNCDSQSSISLNEGKECSDCSIVLGGSASLSGSAAVASGISPSLLNEA